MRYHSGGCTVTFRAFMDISLRSASLIDEVLSMVKSKNLIFGTAPQVPDYQILGIIRCLMKVVLLYLVIGPCQKRIQTYLFSNESV